MNDLSTPEIVGLGFVAVMAVKMSFDVVKSTRQRNGHSVPDPAVVTPATAPEFALMQRQMLANDADTQKRLERIEEMLRDVHEETLDEQVSRHHRKGDLED